MTYTPDTLRCLLLPTAKPSDEVRQIIADCADAWEADRQRLEEAEKAIDDHDRRVIEDGHYCSVIGSAALAAGYSTSPKLSDEPLGRNGMGARGAGEET